MSFKKSSKARQAARSRALLDGTLRGQPTARGPGRSVLALESPLRKSAGAVDHAATAYAGVGPGARAIRISPRARDDGPVAPSSGSPHVYPSGSFQGMRRRGEAWRFARRAVLSDPHQLRTRRTSVVFGMRRERPFSAPRAVFRGCTVVFLTQRARPRAYRSFMAPSHPMLNHERGDSALASAAPWDYLTPLFARNCQSRPRVHGGPRTPATRCVGIAPDRVGHRARALTRRVRPAR